MANKYLQDASGNKSSKRLWGTILLSIGTMFSIILFFYSLGIGAKDADTALGIINTFLISGSSLLGIGIFEKVIRGRKE